MRANPSRLAGHAVWLLAGMWLIPSIGLPSGPAAAQERLPWAEPADPPARDVRPYDDTRREWERDERDRQPPPSPQAEPYRYTNPSDQPRYGAAPPPPPVYDRPGYQNRDDAYRPPQRQDDAYRPPAGPQYGAPYPAPAPAYERGPDYRDNPPPRRDYDDHRRDGTFSMREILDTGHGFFGSVSKGLASVIEHAFKRQGRPNGYILGEDLGGAFVAGLRYGEGTLYTRDAGTHKVYWQGPSIGYDAGAEGSKVMVLIYNLRDPRDIYDRFGGIAGSAYVVGGVGLTFQTNDRVTVAPIRAGIGLRLGANIGYLKYTRRPTWNPF